MQNVVFVEGQAMSCFRLPLTVNDLIKTTRETIATINKLCFKIIRN